MKEKDLPGCYWELTQCLLQYLIKHPDAKDTPEGIFKWWIPRGYDGQREEVFLVLDFLVSKGWMVRHETFTSQKIYGINRERLEEIREYSDAVSVMEAVERRLPGQFYSCKKKEAEDTY